LVRVYPIGHDRRQPFGENRGLLRLADRQKNRSEADHETDDQTGHAYFKRPVPIS